MDPFDPPQAINTCIYCGTDGSGLQDEHIIPYGLNGTWELLNASCSACASITSKFERDVLRNALLAPRTALGFRSYRKNRRPKTLPLTVDRGTGPETTELPIAEHPAIAIFPRFALPARLRGVAAQTGIDVIGAEVVHFGADDPAEFARKQCGSKLTVSATYQAAAFARMVAKIAYGYCVARFGLARVRENYIVPAILGRADDIGMWVGSTEGYLAELSPRPVGRVTHLVGTDAYRGDLVAYVRLFAWAVPSEYVVIVAPVSTDHSDDMAQNRNDIASDA